MADDSTIRPGLVEDNTEDFRVRKADGTEESYPKAGNEGLYNMIKKYGSDYTGATPAVADLTTPAPDAATQATTPSVTDLTSPVGNPAQSVMPAVAGLAPPSGIAAPSPFSVNTAANIPYATSSGVGQGMPAPAQMPNAALGSGLPGGAAASASPMAPGVKTEIDSQTKAPGPIGAADLSTLRDANANLIPLYKQSLEAQQRAESYKATLEAGAYQASAEDFAKRQQIADKEIETQRQQLTDIGKKYAAMPIDSNRLFGEGQTGNHILAAIAFALGGLATGLSNGQTNYNKMVMDNIDEAIKRDIDVQKANKEGLRGEYEMKRGALQDFMQVTKDKELATQAEYARQLGWAAKRADQFATQAAQANPAAAAKVGSLAQDLADKTAMVTKDIDQRVEATKTTVEPRALKIAPPEDLKRLDEITRQNYNLNQIQQLKEGLQLNDAIKKGAPIDTGPLAGRYRQLKVAFGMGDASETEFEKRLNAYTVELGTEIANSRGASPAMQETFKNLSPDSVMKDATFDSQVKNAIADNQKEIASMDNRNRVAYQYLPVKEVAAGYAQQNQPGTATFGRASFNPNSPRTKGK